jgi:hypothetical protein
MRKSIRLLLPLGCLLTMLSTAAGEAPDPEKARQFGWFGTLAGSCWQGEHPDGRTRDTQCYQWQFGRLIRGTISISGQRTDGEPWSLEGDSVFAWIVKDGRIRYSNWADNGSLVHGEAYYEGELLLFPDVRSRDEEPTTRSVWRRLDADSFEVTREARDAGSWREQFKVTYRRAAAAAAAGDPPREN